LSSFVIHFPDGYREFIYPAKPLQEGDLVWHDGVRYRVLAIAQDDGHPMTVTVEPDSKDLGDLLQSEQGGLVLVPVD
jgi:hypothetical protein